MRDRFKSIFSAPESQGPEAAPQFFPPEAFGAFIQGDGDSSMDLSELSAWDIATRYHEFKARPAFKRHGKTLRRLSAEAILARARSVMGSVVHPTERGFAPWLEVPAGAQHVDFDIEESLEQAPLSLTRLAPEDLWMSYSTHRPQPVVLSVDTSLSMTGEKLALTAVALAVVLLEFPEDAVGIVAFENRAQVIKQPEERISVGELVERFLDVPAQGYTHLEDGMLQALKLSYRAEALGRGRPVSTVLLTDGKYTAGRDPAYLASRYKQLVVLKMGKERASLALCEELARKGHGSLREVGELEALPTVMYGVVKDLLRGKG